MHKLILLFILRLSMSANIFLMMGHVQPRRHHREYRPLRSNSKHAMRARARRQSTVRFPRVRRLSSSLAPAQHVRV